MEFQAAAQTTMERFGLKCDDKTIKEKFLRSTSRPSSTEGGGIIEGVMTVKELYDAVA